MTHQFHEEVDALVEAKGLPKALPKGTELHASHEFSSWGGKFAFVDVPWDGGFSPKKMERTYQVRFALELDRRKPMSVVQKFLGAEPTILDTRAQYEKTTWKIGSYAEQLRGGFGPLQDFQIKLSLTNMMDKEHRQLEQFLIAHGYTDVSRSRFSGTKWKRILGMTFTQLEAGKDWETANEVDRVINKDLKVDTMDEDAADRAWNLLGKKGVFAVTQRGRVKFMYQR